MAAPPVTAGAVNATDTCPLPGIAAAPVGAPGNPKGVTRAVATDAGPVPMTFVAVTVKVYPTPFVRPATTRGLAAPLAVNPPGLEVAVYPVIGSPPVEAGGLKA